MALVDQGRPGDLSEAGDPIAGRRYLYYSTSLLCNMDRYSDHQRYLASTRRNTRQHYTNRHQHLSSSTPRQGTVGGCVAYPVGGRKNSKLATAAGDAGALVKEEDGDEQSVQDVVCDHVLPML